MSIINFSRKFLFIHVPKAAGTSVTSALSAYSSYRDIEIGGTALGEAIQPFMRKRYGLSKHVTASQMREIVGEDVWESFYKFTFVRNPFMRCYSTFNFLKGWEAIPDKFRVEMQAFNSFESFVLSDFWANSNGPDRIMKPQATWTLSGKDGDEVILDCIGKVETIDVDLGNILAMLGLSGTNNDENMTMVPTRNRSRPIGTLAWPESVVERIRQRYVQDFQLFGYSKEFPLSLFSTQ